MAGKKTVHAELERQRCLLEQQQFTIRRQQRRLELQYRLIVHVQAQLDEIQVTMRREASSHQTQPYASGSNGNGLPSQRAAPRHDSSAPPASPSA